MLESGPCCLSSTAWGPGSGSRRAVSSNTSHAGEGRAAVGIRGQYFQVYSRDRKRGFKATSASALQTRDLAAVNVNDHVNVNVNVNVNDHVHDHDHGADHVHVHVKDHGRVHDHGIVPINPWT